MDSDKLNAFVGKFINDLGAAMQGPAILIGEQLGLYKALGAGRTGDIGGVGPSDRHHGTIPARVARRAGRFGLH